MPKQLLATGLESASQSRAGWAAVLGSWRSLASAPIDSEDGRALLQSRLAQWARISVALSLSFLLLSLPVSARLLAQGGTQSILAHLAISAFNLALWAATRGSPRSPRALLTLDCVASWVGCGAFFWFGTALPSWMRPELSQLLCCSQLLAVRAFLVPSTPRRTCLIASVPLVAVVIATYFRYAGGRIHPSGPPASIMAGAASVFALSILVITTLTSRTIFGLRERVREAAQLGQYTLLEKIGQGGMGVVYKARHALLRRPTAIKLLPPERAGEHNLARFEREVQLTSALTHPNTVAIYDYGRSAGGVLYYAMEYLDGIDLETLVELAGPQEPGRVVHLLIQVCGALEEAHQVGLIHRDVKPGNILACVRGGSCDVAKIVDFGLVKQLASPTSAITSTVGQIVGTPLYMSPEAIIRPDGVSAASDLYALGAVGYFLLAGQPPFTGGTVMEVCGQHLQAVPEPPSAKLGRPLPEELEAALLGCLAKDPAARPASASALCATLVACRGLSPWSERQARSWWDAQRAAIAAHRRRAAAPEAWATTLAPPTLAVDLRARAAERPRARVGP